MSFQTLKRFTPYFALILLTAPALMGAAPSARTGARAVYDEAVESVVMFGGTTATDPATGRPYHPSETWEFDGTRWIRRFPPQSPPGRSSHVLVYDSNRQQTVMFGGRQTTMVDGRIGADFLNDTWAYRGDWFSRNWEPIETADAPSGRHFAAAAFDSVRDRIVLFGGQHPTEDKKEFVNLYDTWEFDGENWTRVLENGPQIRKPVLAYDAARDQLILLGHDENVATKMYVYDASARAWNELTPETLPPCVNESGIAYDSDQERVVLIGGVCVPPQNPQNSSPTSESTYAWDGENWTEIKDERTLLRTANPAFAYDGRWKSLVLFGGTMAYTSFNRSDTYMYRDENWINPPRDITSPTPRSLYAMVPDPVNNAIWLIGGLSDNGIAVDFWKFQDGFWHAVSAENTPVCDAPVGAFDRDRGRLVLVCGNASTHEWDGTQWIKFENLSTKPEGRRFSAMVYDQNLGKTVLFGGYNDLGEYINKTWTWNGTAWTEVKANKRAHTRALASMWYDPILKKTVVYGGVGRKDREGRIERFNDMWTFDGSSWAEIKPATLPPTRYGAQVAVNPLTGRTILFGGLRVETENNVQRQVYANDTWEWDGSTWRQLQTEGAPPARENASMAWDHSDQGFILFGGWSGYYLSDTWRFDDGRWTVFAE